MFGSEYKLKFCKLPTTINFGDETSVELAFVRRIHSDEANEY